jgi:hypothetical protein
MAQSVTLAIDFASVGSFEYGADQVNFLAIFTDGGRAIFNDRIDSKATLHPHRMI